MPVGEGRKLTRILCWIGDEEEVVQNLSAMTQENETTVSKLDHYRSLSPKPMPNNEPEPITKPQPGSEHGTKREY